MQRDYLKLEKTLNTTVVWLAESEYSDNLIAEFAETAEMYIESVGCTQGVKDMYQKAEILRCLPIATVYGIIKELIFKQIFQCRFMLDPTCSIGFDVENVGSELQNNINDTCFIFSEVIRRWNDIKPTVYENLDGISSVELLKE